MAVALKPSVNAFALLEGNDPGDTRLADVGAQAKADAAASRPVNINKKQQPQMSAWKANKLKAEAQNKQQQTAAPKAKTNTAANAGKGKTPHQKKPHQPAASKSNAQFIGAAANAGKSKMPQQPAARKAQASTAAANAYPSANPAPANLTQVLFGNAYPSARALIYQNRKQSALAHAAAKAGGAPTTDEKKSANPNGAPKNDAPAPVKEEPVAPVKPVLPPPPPPSLEDQAQFPSLK